MMPSNHLILCCPLLLWPSIFPSIRVFSNESTLHIRWPQYWRFSCSICPSDEYLGLISFRIDWFDLLAVQGTLQESSPAWQFESISSLTLAVFMVQLSYPYMTTGKTIILTIQTFSWVHRKCPIHIFEWMNGRIHTWLLPPSTALWDIN